MNLLPGMPFVPRILVVDDDPSIGRCLARALRDVVHVVCETAPDLALERIRRGERFAVILADIMMPGITGPVLLDRIVAIAPDQREVFVFASGGMSTLLHDMVEASGRPCLLKPISREAILEQICALWSDRGSRMDGSHRLPSWEKTP